MFAARRGLVASLFAAVLGLGVGLPIGAGLLASGNGNTDSLTTGSIMPVAPDALVNPEPVVPAAVVKTVPNTRWAPLTVKPAVVADPASIVNKGSEEFRQALKVLTDGDRKAAYDLGAELSDPLERRTIQWGAVHFGGGAVSDAAVLAFAEDSPGFVPASLVKTRIEQALVKRQPEAAEVIRLLGGAVPNTVGGQILLADAYLDDGQRERAARLARSIWVDHFLDKATEKLVLTKLGELLDADAHWARAVHLMMHDRATATERLLSRLSPEQKSLAVARVAVSRRSAKAKSLLDAVDPSLHEHPVYLFSRAQRARQARLFEQAVTFLDAAKGPLPDAAEWWYERRTIVRDMLAKGNAELAFKAAAGYREGPDGRLVEANFNAGWIALSFLRDATAAKTHFEAMRDAATLPDSVSQANYWLARALRKLGDADGAKAALTTAAEHGTVYYGLLARAELGLKGAGLRELPSWRDRQAEFDSRDAVRGIRLLAANGERDVALPLLKGYASGLKDGADFLLAARLAQELSAQHLAILIADTAEKRGTPLDLFNFPKDGIPDHIRLAEVDRAAVYAITRQESHFRADAVSSAGARGLMQLMPATAKETAEKIGLAYSKPRLTSDPAYNALLGSTYLANQLDRFDGSLLLAAAAYNAGGGNASKWVRAYGDPRSPNVDPVVWVELIPFQETRKYVQRVLGNYLVYKARLGDQSITISEALRKIP